jgi:chorismate mutase
MTRDEALAELAKYRDQIDTLDLRLLELLHERTRVVEKIGQVKQSVQLPVYEPKREDAVFANVTSHNTGPLTPEALQRIFERIIDEMRSLQHMRRQGDEEC